MNRLLFVLVIPAVGCASGAPPADGGITSTLGLALRSGAITVEQTATATVQVDLTRANYAKPVAVTLTGLDAAESPAAALLTALPAAPVRWSSMPPRVRRLR